MNEADEPEKAPADMTNEEAMEAEEELTDGSGFPG